jgi:hypothetical protein
MKNLIFLFLFPLSLTAQLTVNNTSHTPSELVQNILIGPNSNTQISNVVFKGVYNQSSRYQVGRFTAAGNTLNGLDFSEGILLTSGHTSELVLPVNSNPQTSAQISRGYTSSTTGEIRDNEDGDADVLAHPERNINTAVLEFDFVPVNNFVQFRYVFTSEEYDNGMNGLSSINYNCSQYNDKFAFLLSGPGISGGQGYANDAKNIARLANGAEVGINSVNNGRVGSSTSPQEDSYCQDVNSDWTENTASSEFQGPITGIASNGNTQILNAFQGGLVPGQTYHIRLIVTDLKDGAYDSGVFLEAESFVTENTLLPVEMIDFQVRCSDEFNSLNWSTSTERNNDYFILEKADKSANFKEIGRLKGSGNTNSSKEYYFTDDNPEYGIHYYRLSQVDFDGKKKQVKTVSYESNCLPKGGFSVTTFYNAEDNSINFEADSELNETIKFELVNGMGQKVDEFEINFKKGSQKYFLKEKLDHSIYFLTASKLDFRFNEKLFIY